MSRRLPGSAADAVLAELVEEFTNRCQAEPVDIEAFVRDYPEHAEQLRQLLPALNLLADLGRSAAVGDPSGAPHNDGQHQTDGTLGDFRVIREVGRGGMGVVYEAEQVSLRRRVALKVLPFAATLDPRHLQRFKNEAQAAAQLHHTNIVPVHAVGCENGVHYYAMQFIEGQTLAEVVGALPRQSDTPKTKPAALAATPPQKLSRAQDGQGGEALWHGREPLPQPAVPQHEEPFILPAETATEQAGLLSTEHSSKGPAYYQAVARLGIQAAEALEYAHQMGVVHRDIKPANLLLETTSPLGRGVEGLRVWVTDFGLAQVQGDAVLTMTGDLVGTLRYMSPEQALAKRMSIDHHTDIYSLGATLYELLTLRPPFDGKDRQELLRQIAWEEPVAPRRWLKSIAPELETIVLKALEKNPADRYDTAQELADDLGRFLMNEPIRARRSSLVQRARKVARRHPGVTVTVAAAMVVGLLLGIVGLAANNWLVRQEQLRTQQEQLRTQHALDQAEQEKAVAQAVRDFLNKLLAQADPRAQANALLRSGGKSAGSKPNPTIRELLDRAARELAPEKIEEQFPGQPLVQVELLKTLGNSYSGIGEWESAISHLERARDLQIRELGADHAETLATMNDLGKNYLSAGNLGDAARLLEQMRDLRVEKLGRDHPDTLESMNNLARTYFSMGRHEEALTLREEIVTLRRARLGPDHVDTLQSMNNLANSYAALRRFDEACTLHEETLATRRRTLGKDHLDTLQSMNNVANCYAALGRWPDTLKIHEEALERRRSRLSDDHPDTLKSMYNVAVTRSILGQHAEALTLHERVLTLRMKKLPFGHPDTLLSMNELAWILATSMDPKLRDPQRALELAKKAVDLAPRKGDFQNTLGAAYYRVGDWQGAVSALEKSTELRKGGESTDWFFLAMAHWRLGNKSQSRACYDRAVQWMEKNKPQDQELRRFRSEAAALLEIDKE
jgi:serine/threonine protein kinase/predicted Zn-dependent protease